VEDEYGHARLQQILADVREVNQHIRAQTARLHETIAALKPAAPVEHRSPAELTELRSWAADLRSYSDALLLDSHALIQMSDRVLRRARLARSRARERAAPKPHGNPLPPPPAG
jgi:hypothetical protein